MDHYNNTTSAQIQHLGHNNLASRGSSDTTYTLLLGLIVAIAIAIGSYFRQKQKLEDHMDHPNLELPRFESFGNIEDTAPAPPSAEDGDELGGASSGEFDESLFNRDETLHVETVGSHNHLQLERDLAALGPNKQMGFMDGFANAFSDSQNGSMRPLSITPTAKSTMPLMDDSNPDDDGV